MYANTFKLYYRQGNLNFYTVDNFGDLHCIQLDQVSYNIVCASA